MRLSQLKEKKWLYTLLAFLLPLFAMFLFMIIRGFKPFGTTSMLYSDMYHQYYPFFVDYRRALLSGDGLLYNWSIGMGIDYLGLISYYLASPLNLLSVLVPEHLLLDYFSLLMPIKLGFAGMFFAIFLKKIFQKNDLSICLFGCFYAFCAWALGYQWNIMWLDTFALLPLVALGTVSLLRERKFVLYTLTLFLSVFANYYIGLFTCIFVALLFICYEICRWRGFKRFFADLGFIALFSVLAIGMTAILELPAYAALQTTQSTVNKFPKEFKLNIVDKHTWQGLLDAMRQVAGNMNGALLPTFKEGLPNLYCGIGTNILAILFLTCKQVKLRDKICSVLLLLFFNVSFIIRQLDYIWHGFHFTNMIPYRFSFLYSFVLLYMAYRAYLLLRYISWEQVVVAGLLAFGLVLCANKKTDLVFWAYNGLFLILYCTVLLYITTRKGKLDSIEKKRAYIPDLRYKRKAGRWLFWGVTLMEITLILVNFGIHFTGTSVKDYPRGTTYTQSMIRYMQEREDDTLFYRAETTHSQTLNDGALNGYNGISTFTSSANVSVTEFMRVLGYGAKNTYNRYCFEESSPVANLFLNLKYMLERQGKVEENAYFDDLHSFGKVHLLENNAYLPLGFLAENRLADVNFNSGENSLAFQNTLLRAATGINGDVWSFITDKNLSVSAMDVTIRSQSATGFCSYATSESKGGTLIYKYVADRSGLVCVSLNLPKKNKFSFWKNGNQLYSETYSIPQTLSVCNVVPGDVIEVHLSCKAGETGSTTLRTAILDETLFRQAYDILAASTLDLTTFENTLVEGSINCNRDGILYTSIPQNGNWTAYVDGQPAEITLIGNAMIGLQLSQGSHNITFRYNNPAFNLGWRISLVCLVAFLGLSYIIYQPGNKKGKLQTTREEDPK